MLEKDIENLIALYPREFFPKEELTLISQQHSVQRRKIDILFEDKYGRLIIIEVKRGVLSREASGQIIEYYGLLKSIFQERTIELILCANTIPSERKTFLENVGISCKEIPLNLILQVAEKYQYTFSDSEKYRNENHKYDEIRRTINQEVDKTTIWIFQANPSVFDILNALTDEKIGDRCHWSITRHRQEIREGHLALLWMSGKEAGIYAVSQILSNPEITNECEEEKKYWLNTKKETARLWRVRLLIIKRLINYPIFKTELLKIPELNELSIIKQAQGTNFRVRNTEWAIISKMIEERSTYKIG